MHWAMHSGKRMKSASIDLGICLLLSWLLPALIVACSPTGERSSTLDEEFVVEGAELFLSSETSLLVNVPFRMKTLDEGFVYYDGASHEFIVFDYDGEHLFSFGREGRGPGEYHSGSGVNYWFIDNEFLVYDRLQTKLIRYDRNGSWIEDAPVSTELFPIERPMLVNALDAQRFVVSVRGVDGFLLRFVDIGSGTAEGFVRALLPDGDQDSIEIDNFESDRQDILARRVPTSRYFSVLHGHNDTGIYVFHMASAELEKYSHNKELIWHRSLKVPSQEGFFERMLEHDAGRISAGRPTQFGYNYGQDMVVLEDRVAILLHVPEEQPVTVVWVSNNGDRTGQLTYPGIENGPLPFGQPRNFAVAEDRSEIFFLRVTDGEIYRAHWPL